MRNPGSASGGYGTASEFGSLDGWTLAEAVEYLENHPLLKRARITAGGYRWYVFEDRSELHIRDNGQIIRVPRPRYNPDGSRIEGFRINISTGNLIRPDVWHELPRNEHEWVIV